MDAAIKIDPNDADMQGRLELYRQKRPYRDGMELPRPAPKK